MSLGLLRAIFITDPLIVLATIVMGLINIPVSYFDRDGRKQIRLARTWARMLLFAAGVKVRVEGLEKIDPSGSYVFASNHASYMDTPVVLSQIPVPGQSRAVQNSATRRSSEARGPHPGATGRSSRRREDSRTHRPGS